MISEICSIKRGEVISKDYINNNPGIYPVYSSQTQNNGELGKINKFSFSGEYLTWTTDGAYAGSVFYRNGKFNVTNVCGLLQIKNMNEVDIKYLLFILNKYAKKYVNKSMGNPKLMSNVMAKILIPLPPLEIQKAIGFILDLFDKLINNLSEGLPAEIKLRQQQYEYYRDLLLSFRRN